MDTDLKRCREAPEALPSGGGGPGAIWVRSIFGFR